MSVVDGLPFSDEKKDYILKTLDPIMEEMVIAVLNTMPNNPMDFMIEWLRKRSGTSQSQCTKHSLMETNRMLKQELSQLKSSLGEVGTAIARGAAEEKQEDDEEEEEESDDECDEIPESFRKPEAQLGRARQSVSAEAYGNWNQKKAFTAPVYPKTDAQKERLAQTLQQGFMFSALEPADMETVLMAVKEQTFAAGTKIISEGDDGDCLFVIEKGVLDCLKNINGVETVVKTCSAGDVFGELALLYNCPRAATCVAKEDLVAWQLDRESFNAIVKDASVKRRNRYDDFLKSVPILSSVGAYERSQVADALKPETFSKGEVVVKQEEPGDKFYIIEEGRLFANKFIVGEGEKRVMDYKSGDCFGELALLKNQPRAASVIVESDSAKVLSMSRNAFKKMLGPLQDILAAQGAKYN